MNESRKFTVVMPLYNKAPHVTKSIQSVLNQRFGDFELLVVNDASTDGSDEKVLGFTDPRVRLFHRDTPGPGGYAARNLGISHAKGEYIAFLDADDTWMEDHLEKMAALAVHFPEAHFLSSGWKDAWPDGRIVEDAFYTRHAGNGPQLISFTEYLDYCNRGMPPTNTYVACLRNNHFAKDIFPAGKAKRGGDLYAWVYYLAQARTMAWSPHIGAIYNRDAVNRVTQGARSNADLLKLLVRDLSPLLQPEDTQPLLRYCNRRAWEAWRSNLFKLPYSSFNLSSSLHWQGDFPYCMSRALLSLIPSPLFRGARQVKRALKGSASVH